MPPRKRMRLGRLLVDLPDDVLLHIFAFLAPADVVALSTLNRQHRQTLVPHVFARVRACWGQVMALQKSLELDGVRRFVRSVRITDANSYNEYQQDTFGQLLGPQAFPHLERVAVNSPGSSYWLRYNRCTHVRHLALHLDSTGTIKIFHLSHVEQLASLELLALHSYHFNWTEEEEREPTLAVRSLVLQDCTWEYPFDLANFNRLNLLRTLAVLYSQNSPFVLLERFVSFLADPVPQHLASLRNVKVEFCFTQHKRLLTPAVLDSFLNAFTGIEELQLYGWTANLAYLRRVLHRHFEYPVKLKLRVEVLDHAALAVDVPNLTVKVTDLLAASLVPLPG